MLKSIGYLFALIWGVMFLTGNYTVMLITFGVFFVILILGTFIFDRKNKN